VHDLRHPGKGGKVTVEYKCNSCGAEFDSANDLIEHARAEHNVEVE